MSKLKDEKIEMRHRIQLLEAKNISYQNSLKEQEDAMTQITTTNNNLTAINMEIKTERSALIQMNKELSKKNITQTKENQPPTTHHTLIADSNRKSIQPHLDTTHTTWDVPETLYTIQHLEQTPDANINPHSNYFIMLGTNDIRNTTTDPITIAHKLITQAQRIDQITGKPVTIITPPPTQIPNAIKTDLKIMLLNAELQDHTSPHIKVIDTHHTLHELSKGIYLDTDGYHLNYQGGAPIANEINKMTRDPAPIPPAYPTPTETTTKPTPYPTPTEPTTKPDKRHHSTRTITIPHPKHDNTTETVTVESPYIKHIIGKNGQTIKNIRDTTQTEIKILPPNANNTQNISIIGTATNCKLALTLINDIVAQRKFEYPIKHDDYPQNNKPTADDDTYPPELQICKFFLTERGCRYGDECIYHHPTPNTPTHKRQRRYPSQSARNTNYNRNSDTIQTTNNTNYNSDRSRSRNRTHNTHTPNTRR